MDTQPIIGAILVLALGLGYYAHSYPWSRLRAPGSPAERRVYALILAALLGAAFVLLWEIV